MLYLWSIVFIVIATSAGCASMAVTAAGVSSSAAITHTINGITFRTFTEPSGLVKTATIAALKRMGIHIAGFGKMPDSDIEVVFAIANNRDIEIRLEPVTGNATRMRVTARSGGFFYDRATAIEIILQTEKVLNPEVTTQQIDPTF